MMSEAKRLVFFKDEGDGMGPVTVFQPHARPKMNEHGFPIFELREYGAPKPEGVQEMGWFTRRKAERFAADLDADFMEF